ncbi:hypothetical protein ACWCRC_28095 [Streptomyces sp. NPDC001940]|uniref:hypothetical protein n=1 Tax=unclassified Streptomyces TaxID=2593676 RepID=UPI00224DBD6F|nr:hypothetical protein [Streptomyces sp. NBC_00401]MCX5086530.1 hypothetical protein [Streptomyces sp. NBC_00401]
MEDTMQGLLPIKARWACAAALSAALLVASASACASPAPEHAYATPEDLCGTKVSAASLEPLLPPGKTIAARPASAVGVERCRLLVDGKVVFSSSVEKRAAGASAPDVAESAIGVGPTDTRTGTGDGRFIYSKAGAVGRVECSGRPDSSLWVTARTTRPATAADMLKLVKEYANSAAGSGVCDEL